MKKVFAYAAATLPFALIAACATQPVAIPSYLAPTFAQMKLDRVASIGYQDEDGQPISEGKFAGQFKKGRNFEAVKDDNGDMPNVRLRLRHGNADDNPRKLVSFSSRGMPPPGSIADISACAPVYPASELRAKHTGTVMLRFLIGTGGDVKQAEVVSSSGFPGLDEAAKRSLSRCRFIPARSDGVPVEKWGPMKYVWTID